MNTNVKLQYKSPLPLLFACIPVCFYPCTKKDKCIPLERKRRGWHRERRQRASSSPSPMPKSAPTRTPKRSPVRSPARSPPKCRP